MTKFDYVSDAEVSKYGKAFQVIKNATPFFVDEKEWNESVDTILHLINNYYNALWLLQYCKNNYDIPRNTLMSLLSEQIKNNTIEEWDKYISEEMGGGA